ncbi:MAG: glycosyltransferase family 4 protein [bacterium]|nr:glycosyltransferase family 4 protein [bacterium]
MSRIFITSYPYVYERYFKVWDYFSEKDRLVFILPKKWTAKKGKILVEAPRREDLRIIPVPAYFNHSHYPLIRGLLKGWMPQAKRIIKDEAQPGDILYTAIEPNLLTTYLNSKLAKKLGMKHVFFTWQNVPYKKRLHGSKLRITERLIRKTIANSVGAIAGNTKAAEILREYLPAEASAKEGAGPDFKILVAPISGVDVKSFRPKIQSDFRQKYNLEGKTVLTFAGVFDERKGIPALLEAFEQSQKENSNLHLVMIGVGKLQKYIEDFVRDHQLEDKVTMIKWLPNEELPGVLCASDIFVHPSEPFGGWEEQFGYSMAEASACGLSVISTHSGSIDELIIDGKSGILIEPGNREQLKEAILKMAADRHWRGNLGMMGRMHMEENYGHDIIAEKFSEFFKQL